MEKQLLYLLDYDLRFDETEACKLFAPFMSSSIQDASTRASAVDRVVKAGRARAQAQAQQLQTPPTPPHSTPSPPTAAVLPAPSSTLASTVRGIAKRLSSTHLSVPVVARSHPAPAMYTSLSTDSSSSSEMGSLVDDSGSSSSSSGWLSGSDDEDSNFGDEGHGFTHRPPSCNPDSDVESEAPVRTSSRNSSVKLRPFALRPVPAYTHKSHHLVSQARNRVRKPSDTSSINTVTASSPPAATSSLLRSRGASRTHRDTQRCTSVLLTSASGGGGTKEVGLAASVTLPSIPRAGVSGGFLSRMWEAATKGQEKSQSSMTPSVDIVDPAGAYHQGQGPSAFRRLVLVHSRANAMRGPSGHVIDV